MRRDLRSPGTRGLWREYGVTSMYVHDTTPLAMIEFQTGYLIYPIGKDWLLITRKVWADGWEEKM